MRVTCLCLTKNRRTWLPKAIDCFEQQTYPDKELLIVADGEDVSDLIPADPRIRLIARGGVIGEKRNLGCEQASGEVIAHWDDDDYSAHGRLSDQINRLAESGKSVTGYYSMRFFDVAHNAWWEFKHLTGYALGSSLCYRKAFWETNRFRPLQIAEDNHFVAAAGDAGQLVTAEAKEFMYATIHGTNTSPRSTKGSTWKPLTGFQLKCA